MTKMNFWQEYDIIYNPKNRTFEVYHYDVPEGSDGVRIATITKEALVSLILSFQKINTV